MSSQKDCRSGTWSLGKRSPGWYTGRQLGSSTSPTSGAAMTKNSKEWKIVTIDDRLPYWKKPGRSARTSAAAKSQATRMLGLSKNCITFCDDHVRILSKSCSRTKGSKLHGHRNICHHNLLSVCGFSECVRTCTDRSNDRCTNLCG